MKRATEKQVTKNNIDSYSSFPNISEYPEEDSNIQSIHKSTARIRIVDLPQNKSYENSILKAKIKELEQQNRLLNNDLQNLNIQFSEVLENQGLSIVVMNEKFKIIQANNCFAQLSGISQDILIKKSSISSFFPRKFWKNIQQTIKISSKDNSLNPFKNQTHKTLFFDKNCDEHIVELNITHLSNRSCFILSIKDITELENEKQKMINRNKALTILNSISEFNQQPKKLHQILKIALERTKQLSGMNIGVIYLGDNRIKTLKPIASVGLSEESAKKLLERNISSIKEFKKNNQNLFINQSSGIVLDIFTRRPRCKSIALIPLSFKKNKFGILSLISTDQILFSQERKDIISAIGHQLANKIENIIIFNELEEKSKEVDTKNKELSSFVYTVSHDLKTPIIAFHGFLNLFLEKYQNQIGIEGQEIITRVLHNAEYMERMINDLLKLSRAGRVLGAKRRISTYKLVNEVYSYLYPHFQKNNVSITFSKSLPLIYADRQRIQTVFENLISNSIKYSYNTNHPTIEIDFKEKNNYYQFAFRDNGIGIAKEDQQKVFEVFHKCNNKDHDTGGTGVGLTIVKKIIEHHGGNVWIESKLNKGTTIYFTLPKN